jgi:hypothetical protein
MYVCMYVCMYALILDSRSWLPFLPLLRTPKFEIIAITHKQLVALNPFFFNSDSDPPGGMYMHVCTYACVIAEFSMYASKYDVYACIHSMFHLHTCMCVCINMYLCLHVCMRTCVENDIVTHVPCVYACMLVSTYTHTYTYTFMYICT